MKCILLQQLVHNVPLAPTGLSQAMQSGGKRKSRAFPLIFYQEERGGPEGVGK